MEGTLLSSSKESIEEKMAIFSLNPDALLTEVRVLNPTFLA